MDTSNFIKDHKPHSCWKPLHSTSFNFLDLSSSKATGCLIRPFLEWSRLLGIKLIPFKEPQIILLLK